MTNLFMFAVFCFISAAIIGSVSEGNGGLATAILAAAMDKDDLTATVDSTANWPDPPIGQTDFFTIENEIICYTGLTATSFTGLERGCKGSNATSHAVGSTSNPTILYNETTGTINRLLGFYLLEMLADDGLIIGGLQVLVALPGYFSYAIPKIVMLDFSMFNNIVGQYIKYILWFTIGVGLVISFFQLIFRRAR